MSHHQLRPTIYKELRSIMHTVLVSAVKGFGNISSYTSIKYQLTLNYC